MRVWIILVVRYYDFVGVGGGIGEVPMEKRREAFRVRRRGERIEVWLGVKGIKG